MPSWWMMKAESLWHLLQRWGGKEKKTGSNVEAAKEVGKRIAVEAKKKNIQTVVFDRGGYIYHGRVKAFAESAREQGLKF